MTQKKTKKRTHFKLNSYITLKYYFPFTNGHILIESVTHILIKTNYTTILFLQTDDKSVQASTFALNRDRKENRRIRKDTTRSDWSLQKN